MLKTKSINLTLRQACNKPVIFFQVKGLAKSKIWPSQRKSSQYFDCLLKLRKLIILVKVEDVALLVAKQFTFFFSHNIFLARDFIKL